MLWCVSKSNKLQIIHSTSHPVFHRTRFQKLIMDSSSSAMGSSDANKEILTLMKNDLLQCIEEGVKHYKSLMDTLLDTKQPLKDTQLIGYHNITLKVTKKAFLSVYIGINQIQDESILQQIKQLISQATKRLETLLMKELNEIYLRKHEIQIDGVVKKVKSFTNEAEMLYDERMEQFQMGEKSRSERREAHDAFAKEAMESFELLLDNNKIHKDEFWKIELNHKLGERLDDIMNESSAEEREEQLTPLDLNSQDNGPSLQLPIIPKPKRRPEEEPDNLYRPSSPKVPKSTKQEKLATYEVPPRHFTTEPSMASRIPTASTSSSAFTTSARVFKPIDVPTVPQERKREQALVKSNIYASLFTPTAYGITNRAKSLQSMESRLSPPTTPIKLRFQSSPANFASPVTPLKLFPPPPAAPKEEKRAASTSSLNVPPQNTKPRKLQRAQSGIISIPTEQVEPIKRTAVPQTLQNATPTTETAKLMMKPDIITTSSEPRASVALGNLNVATPSKKAALSKPTTLKYPVQDRNYNEEQKRGTASTTSLNSHANSSQVRKEPRMLNDSAVPSTISASYVPTNSVQQYPNSKGMSSTNLQSPTSTQSSDDKFTKMRNVMNEYNGVNQTPKIPRRSSKEQIEATKTRVLTTPIILTPSNQELLTSHSSDRTFKPIAVSSTSTESLNTIGTPAKLSSYSSGTSPIHRTLHTPKQNYSIDLNKNDFQNPSSSPARGTTPLFSLETCMRLPSRASHCNTSFNTSFSDAGNAMCQEMKDYNEVNPNWKTNIYNLNQQMEACKIFVKSRELPKPERAMRVLHQNMKHYLQSPMDIGIYIDGNTFMIGTYQLSFTELQSVTPEIYFSEYSILIGSEANPYSTKGQQNCNYFQVHQLILSTKPSALRNVYIGGQRFVMCVHEIVALFLQTLLQRVMHTYRVQIGRIVVTIPFAPTSAVKEQLREAARIAGYEDVRILSSVITTAISSLEKFEYFTNNWRRGSNKTQKPRQIFVLDFQKWSFSAALIVFRQENIHVKNPYGSENMKECQEELFLQLHERLYDGQKVSQVGEEYIRQVYKKAISHVLEKALNFPVDRILVSETKEGILLEKIVFSILKGNVMVFNSSVNPLVGASILASANSKFNSLIPPTISVLDSSRCDLRLVFTTSWTEKISLDFMGKKFMEGYTFCRKLSIPVRHFPVLFIVHLEEIYGPEECTSEACRYQLTLQCDSSNKEDLIACRNQYIKMKVDGSVDADGVFSLTAECFSKEKLPLEFSMQRTDNLVCNHGLGCPLPSGYQQILTYFDSVQSNQVKGTYV